MSSMADVEVLIVGAGFSGICMAIKLLEASLSSFVILERCSDIGGSWFFNRYPGCRSDIPGHFYCYSFARNPSWTTMYPSRSELHQYLKDCASLHGVLPKIRFNTVATSATWNAVDSLWRVEVKETLPYPSSEWSAEPPQVVRTSVILARYVIRAVGGLHLPNYPDIPGVENFTGMSLHSSLWPDNGINLKGKTVAIMGTGASGIQLVPALAPDVEKLYVLQRSGAWVVPKPPNCTFSKRTRQCFAQFPFLMFLFYWILFLLHELIIWWVLEWRYIRRIGEWLVRWNMRRTIKCPDLLRKLEPTYEMGCKRILLSNDFYPAFARPNVNLIRESVLEIREKSLILSSDDGAPEKKTREIPIDVLIYATGFKLTSDLQVVGRCGIDFNSAGFSTLLGITKHGFPNFFMLFGFNTGVAQTSQILTIEAQVRYIVQCLGLMKQRGARSMEARTASEKRHQDFISQQLPKVVWTTGGCSSWYNAPGTHHNFAMWPASTMEYLRRSRNVDPQHYLIQ
ncbi:hypothetical protein KP509_10G019200 [Ceratopteris richardii]|uniref:Flavin-containing monooxygenase n=1 Tax=Ceratopteris richardii TaxID=49495 RepID=A0A8T2TZN5_CERRI|nr:hypothetical protein KP509_10G019200 [Ceratopteris richardii]